MPISGIIQKYEQARWARRSLYEPAQEKMKKTPRIQCKVKKTALVSDMQQFKVHEGNTHSKSMQLFPDLKNSSANEQQYPNILNHVCGAPSNLQIHPSQKHCSEETHLTGFSWCFLPIHGATALESRHVYLSLRTINLQMFNKMNTAC